MTTVEVSGNLITGQNPMSSKSIGLAIVKELEKKRKIMHQIVWPKGFISGYADNFVSNEMIIRPCL